MTKNRYCTIIPAYNAESTITETINAILNQTHEPDEILIVDDHSTDCTEEIVRQIKDKRIKYSKLDNNTGTAAAPRNYGLQLCNSTNKYIAFCDADDIWMPDKMEQQLTIMEQLASNFSFTNVIKFKDNTKKSVPPKQARNPSVVTISDFKYNNPIKSGSTVVISSQIRQHLKFPSGRQFRALEDYYAWIEVLSNTHIVAHHLQQPLVYYRQHPGSLSSSKLFMHQSRKLTYKYKTELLNRAHIKPTNFYIAETLYLLNQIIYKT